jgi:hypothetical protein
VKPSHTATIGKQRDLRQRIGQRYDGVREIFGYPAHAGEQPDHYTDAAADREAGEQPEHALARGREQPSFPMRLTETPPPPRMA